MMNKKEKDSERTIFQLSDEVVFQIAKLVQMSMLTGTNVVDHFRQMRLELSQDDRTALALTPEYNAYFDNTVRKMTEAAEQFQTEVGELDANEKDRPLN